VIAELQALERVLGRIALARVRGAVTRRLLLELRDALRGLLDVVEERVK